MPITSLNKVISSFLVGILGVALFALPFYQTIFQYMTSITILATPSAAVAVGFLLFAVSSLVGAVIDSVADVSIRDIVVHSAGKNTPLARCFLQGHLAESSKYWEVKLVEICEKSPKYRVFVADPLKSRYSIGSAIYFAKANKDLFEWVYSQYASYYLATNFVVIVLCGQTVAFINAAQIGVLGLAGISMLGFIVCYLLISLSIDRYIYTNLVMHRFACIYLIEAGEQEDKAPNQNSA